jgi:hypothetical protein
MTPSLSRLLFAAAGLAAGGPLFAQSFVDLIESRNPAMPFASIFQAELGMIGTRAEDEAPLLGLDDELSVDARLYYRDESFSSRRGTLEAYAGRDGIFGSFTDGKLVGDETVTRFEVRARPWMFYRDGFYRDERLIANGFFDGEDYEGYIGFGREAQPGLYVELGPFYRKLDFSPSKLTPITYTVPDDYSAYGGRLYLEQSNAQLDRRRGLPREGYTVTVSGEREWNDSDAAFGTAGFSSTLPSAVWRARGRLEWYIPSADTAVWEVFAQGGWHDEKDRLQNVEGQRPLGNIWADAQLRWRIHLGQSWSVTPFFHGQYSRLLDETGFGSSKDFFLGGGAETYVHLGEALSIHAWYSFLDNDSRPSVRIDNDVHGEHMFYVGMVLRLGVSRR